LNKPTANDNKDNTDYFLTKLRRKTDYHNKQQETEHTSNTTKTKANEQWLTPHAPYQLGDERRKIKPPRKKRDEINQIVIR
jgi:hypothetical protein